MTIKLSFEINRFIQTKISKRLMCSNQKDVIETLS